ncbi:MAG: hypothetical protein LLG20_24190 [Acidobacteriales bacterium]|nr:hypothetical protein [Terriglobales bacterium]
MNTSTGLTGIIIQSRLLETRLRHEDHRRATWTVLAFVAGVACGIVIAFL